MTRGVRRSVARRSLTATTHAAGRHGLSPTCGAMIRAAHRNAGPARAVTIRAVPFEAIHQFVAMIRGARRVARNPRRVATRTVDSSASIRSVLRRVRGRRGAATTIAHRPSAAAIRHSIVAMTDTTMTTTATSASTWKFRAACVCPNA